MTDNPYERLRYLFGLNRSVHYLMATILRASGTFTYAEDCAEQARKLMRACDKVKEREKHETQN